MANLKEKVEKITSSWLKTKPNVSDREYDRIMRQLMLRLIDVEEMFPGEYDYYEEVKDEYLPDFLKYEENRDYSYSVETSRGGGYKLVVTDWSTDYRRDTVIKIPSFLRRIGATMLNLRKLVNVSMKLTRKSIELK